MQPRIKNKSALPTQEYTMPDQSKRSFTVAIDLYTVYHLLMKNNKVEERGGGVLKREGGLKIGRAHV